MSKELDEVRKIFLTNDLDEETREENEETLREWEQTLFKNQSFIEWRGNDITREIAAKARELYRETAYLLASNRSLTDEQRKSYWAKQDAALWILTLTEKDAQSEIDRVNAQIKTALGKI